MLEIKKKKYEIEEVVKLTDSENKTLYEFTMQITENELQEIREILFKDAESLKKEYISAPFEEKEKLEEKLNEKIKSKTERFEDICFKEHKDKFRELAGEYKFKELVDDMMGFFIEHFVQKQLKPVNTTITNLTNLTKTFQQFK